MGARNNKNTTAGGGFGAAIRRVLTLVAIALIAVLVGVALGTSVIPVPSFLEGVLPKLGQSASDAFVAWDAAEAPEYYRVIGSSQIDWSLEPGETAYGALDSLGRATFARACVTRALVEEGSSRPRGDLHELEPSGWGNNGEVDIALATGEVYHGFLWNRSHLLAKSLGGSDELNNLITGTRTQNVGSDAAGDASGGMAYCERLARNWVYAHADGWLYYAATPVYVGEELVCRSVMVDMRSSDGTLDLRIEVYNSAKGIAIDYRTGEFRQTEDLPVVAPTTTADSSSDDPDAQDYVLNVNTNKFHLPGCESVDEMADHNRRDVHATRESLIAQGYEPCGSCRP